MNFAHGPWVIVSLVCLSLLPFSAVGSTPKTPAVPSKPTLLEQLEATVNGALILNSDLAHFRKTLGLRQQLDPLFAGTPLAGRGKGASDKEIIDYLIDEKIILAQFPVSDSEVEQEINTIQANNNRMDRASLKAALAAEGYAFNDYFDLIRIGVAKRALIDRDIQTKVSISEDDVKNHFYNQLAKNSAIPRAFKVRIITITPSNYKSIQAAKEQIDRAKKQVGGGEPFEEVAKAISDDSTASSGGDLGTLTEDQMSPGIRDALKKLKIGESSEVLGDPKSRFFILKLVDVTSAESDKLKQQREEIRTRLAAAEYQRQIQLWLDRQRQTASVHRSGQRDLVEN
jgi:peptidyl-prolyl cis-trans isomerase SurA